jgi:RNA polymerase sigma factor (sigma-70 family)
VTVENLPPSGHDSDGGHGGALEQLRLPLIGYFRRRVRPEDDVGDLVQEVLVRLAKPGAVADIDNLGGGVFRVAASVLTDRQRRHENEHAAGKLEHVGGSDVSLHHTASARRVLIAALSSMPERTRTVFVLRRLDRMPPMDIANRLGLSLDAVERHLVRAMMHLAALKEIR